MPLTLTFIVTEQCQLRCKYCYVINKSNRFMTFDVAKRAFDCVLIDKEFNIYKENKEGLNIDFIGGEPLLKIDLMNNIVDYILQRTYELNHIWFDNIRISISTNGLLYRDIKVQRFIEKFKRILEIAITLDGTPNMHNAGRVYSDGSGSYEDVIKSIPLWLVQFPNVRTKVTIAPENINMLSEAILHLFDLGIEGIHANCIFEPVWEGKHAVVLYEQMLILAKKMKEKNISLDKVSLFDEFIGKPLNPEQDNNWCGTGKYMITVGTNGDFYPCFRFADINTSKKTIRLGNTQIGIDHKARKPFLDLSRIKQSPLECLECEVASGCAWCNGCNQEYNGKFDKRLTAICIMHKARVRAKNFVRKKYDNTGERNE